MADVYCNNCGHKNLLGSNFCSSCGAVLETGAADSTTITFHPTSPSDPVDDDVSISLDDLPDAGVLVVKRGPKAGSRFMLDRELTTAGRHPDSDIFLDDVTVSRRHAEFRVSGSTCTVCDAGSLNGTYVNRERIDEQLLATGDEVQIGKFKLVYFAGDQQTGGQG